ncbi:MAG: ATP-dependent sacrificial sulfur transferase LarE [Lachnospiraceae bacterium]|nr:ATP-dependent sacrificial sulfur transferase LarE [Lachnospiraceae bacterium]
MDELIFTEEEETLAHRKYERLKAILQATGGIAVAFSGGVDSTLLLYAAWQALGDRALAVTVSSGTFPRREIAEAEDFCHLHGIRQRICPFEELSVPGFEENPKERCYICKKDLFGRIRRIAAENGLNFVAEGSNMDDNRDYRPGMRAIAELGIRSPLREVELSKREIRYLSREHALPSWDKPSYACLATRIPYGERITKEKLLQIERSEQLLIDKGFRQVRVRLHGNIARIEIPPEDFGKLVSDSVRTSIVTELKEIGFDYVTLDLMGYRTGSMNINVF